MVETSASKYFSITDDSNTTCEKRINKYVQLIHHKIRLQYMILQSIVLLHLFL